MTRADDRASRLPPWSGDFARQSLANALGTLIAALTIFLGGVLFGAIQDVSTSSIVAALAGLVGALSAAVSVALGRRIDAVSRPIQRARVANDRVMADTTAVQALVVQAQAARDRGDMDEAARLVEEIDSRLPSLQFAVDEAGRYTDEAEHIAERYGYRPARDEDDR